MKFEDFFQKVLPIMVSENCNFGYQRKNCKKHGHYKKITNKITNSVTYEIKIEKYDNDAAKIYTLVHEMTHMINKHLDNNQISNHQKEWVADYVGIRTVEYLSMKKEFLNSNLASKWDVLSYGKNHIKDKKITDKKRKLMHVQSQYAYQLILMHLKRKG